MGKSKKIIINGISIDLKVMRKETTYPCSQVDCQADCCSGGVWVKDEEYPPVMKWKKAVKACLPKERHDESQWFEKDDDAGYGTQTVDDPQRPGKTCCVFLQADRKCSLQVVSRKKKLGWPGIKPYYCAIYPLYEEDGEMTVDDDTPVDKKTGMCRKYRPGPEPLFEMYPDETKLILGENGYRELQARAKELDVVRKQPTRKASVKTTVKKAAAAKPVAKKVTTKTMSGSTASKKVAAEKKSATKGKKKGSK